MAAKAAVVEFTARRMRIIRSAATSFVRNPFDHQYLIKCFFKKRDREELRCRYQHCTDAAIVVRQLLQGLVGLQHNFR
jgi:hypothetical protein